MDVPDHQVFISFRGVDVRRGFLSFLEDGLEKACIKYYVDAKEMRGEVLDILFKRIQESRLVLIIFSQNITNSSWCIKELLTTMDVIGPRLKIIPIFYNVKVQQVVDNWDVAIQAMAEEGEEIGDDMEKRVKEALGTLTRYMGIRSNEYQNDFNFIEDIVKEVKKVLNCIELMEKEKCFGEPSEEKKQDLSLITRNNLTGEVEELETRQKVNFVGITQRLQKLTEKSGMECDAARYLNIFKISLIIIIFNIYIFLFLI